MKNTEIPKATHIYRHIKTKVDVRFGFRRHVTRKGFFECVAEDGSVIGNYSTEGHVFRMGDGLSGYTIFDMREPTNQSLMANERGK